MKTQVFAYKGYIGIASGDKFINDPTDAGQMGCVVALDQLDITQEAFDIIKHARREGGSFANIMVTTHAGAAIEKHGKGSFAFMGYGHSLFDGKNLHIGRDCTPHILEECVNNELQVPDDLKAVIDNLK